MKGKPKLEVGDQCDGSCGPKQSATVILYRLLLSVCLSIFVVANTRVLECGSESSAIDIGSNDASAECFLRAHLVPILCMCVLLDKKIERS